MRDPRTSARAARELVTKTRGVVQHVSILRWQGGPRGPSVAGHRQQVTHRLLRTSPGTRNTRNERHREGGNCAAPIWALGDSLVSVLLYRKYQREGRPARMEISSSFFCTEFTGSLGCLKTAEWDPLEEFLSSFEYLYSLIEWVMQHKSFRYPLMPGKQSIFNPSLVFVVVFFAPCS